ncbi:hypothetical protein CDL15_Pgr005923 [Punica granatum]|uniref:Pentatricopeptide repeat-containing protein At4g32430, mitochondrial n=1 Tax=Punica granatum TaxID=22663 RepID=A0A218WFZ1_PUNGR|nr:hypothetical protein CDL15_Pgr005923 [Punica granatum]
MIARRPSVRALLRTTHQPPIDIKNFHSSKHANQLFDRSFPSNILSVNRSMLEHIHKNRPGRSLDIFRGQLQLGFSGNVDEATVAVALKACNGDLGLGCQLHGFAISSGFVLFTTVSNSLMNLYFKAGTLDSALNIFENIDDPDVVSWNTVLSGSRDSESAFAVALAMNRKGVSFDAVTYTKLLSYCLDLEGFLFGLQLHCPAMKCGLDCEVFVANALITLYARQGLLVDGRKVFDEMPTHDLVSWGAMISGYTQEGNYGSESIRLLIRMLREGMRPDHVSLTGAVSACSQEGNFELGRQIHGLSVKIGQGKHTSVCNILMAIYSKAQATEDVKLVFKNMLERNVISWTTMISADEREAVSLFNSMRWEGICPNDVTFVGLLHSITSRNLVPEGRMVHGYCIRTGFTSELNVSNCLITMYAKFEEMESAKRVFEEAPSREIISWNALISGYAQNGMCQEALEMYFSAIMESFQPNPYTFGSALSAIGSAESISLRQGQRCHSHIIKLGLDSNSIVSGSLLDMYAKRGSISESLSVFSQTSRRSQFAWTAIISAHARHGDYDSAMELFKEMEEEGVKPDLITYLSVLTACGRKGMVDVGREVFKSMIRDHSIEPSHEHYSCMVDMLGRAGQLNEAEELLGQTPGGPRLSALQSLLGACRVHGNMEMAERVVDALMEIEPMESGSYVLMSNLYAEKGHWEKVAEIRKGMRERGVVKEIGFSWVDDGSLSLHGFSSGDMSHPQSDDIFSMAHCLGLEMQFLREKDDGEDSCNISSTREESLASL